METAPLDAEDFVRRFQQFWRAPSPAGLSELLTADVRLVQPLSRTTHGLAAGQRYFAKLLARVPDLHAEVDRWAASGPHVFIEFRLRTHTAGELFEWPAVDALTLEGPLARERVSYFDGVALLQRVARRPSAWWHAIRALQGPAPRVKL